jgi:hypothetical protein
LDRQYQKQAQLANSTEARKVDLLAVEDLIKTVSSHIEEGNQAEDLSLIKGILNNISSLIIF